MAQLQGSGLAVKYRPQDLLLLGSFPIALSSIDHADNMGGCWE